VIHSLAREHLEQVNTLRPQHPLSPLVVGPILLDERALALVVHENLRDALHPRQVDLHQHRLLEVLQELVFLLLLVLLAELLLVVIPDSDLQYELLRVVVGPNNVELIAPVLPDALCNSLHVELLVDVLHLVNLNAQQPGGDLLHLLRVL